MKKPKRRKRTIVRTGLPAATWRMLNSEFDGFSVNETLNLSKMIELHNHFANLFNQLAEPSKEITQAKQILEKHLLTLIKSIKRVTK